MRLGDYLYQKGLIRLDQLDTALREQNRSRRFLGDILVALGFIKETVLYSVLAECLGVPYLEDISSVHTVDLGGWVELEVKPRLVLATPDPDNIFLSHRWSKRYGRQPDQVFLISNKQLSEVATSDQPLKETIPDLFKTIVLKALSHQASDIHFIPGHHHCQIHLRVDGVLTSLQTIHKDQWQQLCAHIKILGQLDLAENRRPQDGAFRLTYLPEPIDCRLSIMPTKDGESLVIRLLDPRSIALGLDHLGLRCHQQEALTRIAQRPGGLFVITGPTGSGKTTTLYAMLSAMAGQGRNVMTVEQPIEYRLDHIRQTEIHPDVTSFGDALRAILRHDPDVIYVSEIRDAETAMTAVRAAMTGHLVLTTLHVTDVRLVSRRLEDLGVPPGYLKGVLLGAMAQRLVRRKCCHDGCDHCLGMGYRGRQIVAELFDQGHDILSQYASRPEERMALFAEEDIHNQVTTRLEIHRVLGESEFAHVA